MTVCGIVAEYNPFHTGHAHHIAQTQRALGGEAAIVCAMSGNFVQRGDFAVLDKYARAEMAVRGGADLVVELPLAAALSSAEGFARGAIGVLRALGCNVVSFGAETPDTALIERAARALDALPPTGGGASRCLTRRGGRTSCAGWMSGPLPCWIRPTIRSRSNTAVPCFPMACARSRWRGAARRTMRTRPARASLPPACCVRSSARAKPPAARPICRWTRWRYGSVRYGPALRRSICRRICYSPCCARRCSQGGCPAGADDGFDERLQRAVYAAVSFTDAVEQARTRRFPAARVRRALLRTAIGLPADAPVRPQYLRVLALGPKGRGLLRGLPDRPPVIIRPVSEKRLPAALQPALTLDCFADDLYALACPSPALRAGGSHYRRTPFILSPPPSHDSGH